MSNLQRGTPDAVPCGLLEINLNNFIVDTNTTFARWVGLSVSETIGLSLLPFFGGFEVDSAPLPPFASLIPLVAVDGTARPVFVSAGESGPDGHKILAVFDATKSQQIEAETLSQHALAQRTQSRLELVLDASIAFAAAETESELAEILVATTTKAYAAEESVVFLLDEDNQFQQVAGSNPLAALDDAKAMAKEAMALRGVVKISGVAEATAISQALGREFSAAGVHAMVVAPIHQHGRSLGIVAVFFLHPRQFDEQASPLAAALAGQAAQVISSLRLQSQMVHAATHDATTGLANRRMLEERMEDYRQNSDEFVAVFFIDMDGFKTINDERGHHAGDELLKVVGRRIKATIRDDDLAVRYGGDEFVVVCNVGTAGAAEEISDRIREALAAPYHLSSGIVHASASIGLALANPKGALGGPDRLLRAADQAMYRAKSAGGGQVVLAR